MMTLKIAGLLSALAVFGSFGSVPAHAEYICYPYADGAPGGYNKITHKCNPLWILWHGTPNKFFYKDGGPRATRHATLYGPNLQGNHPVRGRKY